jgi:hypothetical protein
MPLLADYEEGMARCRAEVWELQKTCDYAEKSAYADRCLFYVSDTYGSRRCDNLCVLETVRERRDK